jgi:hypothetical protein
MEMCERPADVDERSPNRMNVVWGILITAGGREGQG